ncbi:hypothetical protein C6Y45_11280 [Alkalicoccus saliphilus]|uniref:Uncharacterized protein n=1 Tax=Alkalicoccus saliphilus TaxID=200989 RepID=A0A2T4U4Z7_9BACI|nr:hypothetical protein C6Y45_11280 [Alkalicoccus saliphilus]
MKRSFSSKNASYSKRWNEACLCLVFFYRKLYWTWRNSRASKAGLLGKPLHGNESKGSFFTFKAAENKNEYPFSFP